MASFARRFCQPETRSTVSRDGLSEPHRASALSSWIWERTRPDVGSVCANGV
jgi:hypothetical protein